MQSEAARGAAVTLYLDEGDRQMVLLALARLSAERRGWSDALNAIALQIDNQHEGRALMFEQFRVLALKERSR